MKAGLDNEKKVVLIGWEIRNVSNSYLSCCLYMKNGSLLIANLFKKIKSQNADVNSVLYICPVRANLSSIQSVSLISENNICSLNQSHYIKPSFQNLKNKFDIAVCGKLTYHSANAERLIEWFEVLRLLGVNKVLTYTYQLNLDAVKVLKY